jgi:hypothetical protein
MRDNPARAITAASAVPGFSGPARAIGNMNLLGVVPLDPRADDALQVSDGVQLRDPEDRAIRVLAGLPRPVVVSAASASSKA